jgi:lipopolysaccharide export system ATP-binding protein
MSNLTIKNLIKTYTGQALAKKVTNNVSIAINSKEIIGLLGPNGAGKTSLFYMILGLLRPDSGSIELDDVDITHSPIHERAKLGIGYLPQEASIFRKLSVADNILAILELNLNLSLTQRQERVDKLLEEFGLTRVRDSMGMSLSGGERRRAEIARALANNPKFILLDEPFAGVDPIAISDIKKIIKYLSQRDIGVLITDHNVRDTLDICDRAYILSEGQVISSGTSKEIIENQTVRAIYLGENFSI